MTCVNTTKSLYINIELVHSATALGSITCRLGVCVLLCIPTKSNIYLRHIGTVIHCPQYVGPFFPYSMSAIAETLTGAK